LQNKFNALNITNMWQVYTRPNSASDFFVRSGFAYEYSNHTFPRGLGQVATVTWGAES
jgi:hypothetical protein